MTRAIQSLVLSLAVIGLPLGVFGEDKPVGKTVYDPLKKPAGDSVETIDFTIEDKARSREIPVRVYLPKETTPAPVILFSHGLGGARVNSPYLGNHWAGRGYVCVFMQHHGSDESVWKDAPLLQRMKAMRAAAGLENFLLRIKDVPAVIDQLEIWNKTSEHPLAGRMDLKRIGMTGHSFGAVTTQAVSGQVAGRGRLTATDSRIRAALPMSPSCPKNTPADQAFGKVSIPWMLMTGTNDEAAIGDTTVEERLAVFPGLPAGDKYELVLNKGEHSAFSDRPLPGDKEQRNPNHHRVILALSTAFWDAYLREDLRAKEWLQGEGPKGLMEKEDRWQIK